MYLFNESPKDLDDVECDYEAKKNKKNFLHKKVNFGTKKTKYFSAKWKLEKFREFHGKNKLLFTLRISKNNVQLNRNSFCI